MKSFVKINLGDIVFDDTQEIEGVVTAIDYSSNVAEVTIELGDDGEENILCRLSNLTVLTKSQKNKKEKEHDHNKWFYQVEEFHKAFSHPIADKPTRLSPERAVARSVWKVEEIIEFLESSVSNEDEFLYLYNQLLEGMEKAKHKSLANEFPKTDQQKLVAQSDALVDALYFILGSFTELGIKPDKLFDIVHSANMSKLFTDEDGNKYAKYRESDGKILKSPEFFPPEPALEEEVKKQLNN